MNRFRPSPCRWTGLLLLAAAALPLQAQTLPPPTNVVSLSASASAELAHDWLTIVLSTSRDGADAGAVQAQLKQALDAALTEARKLAKPGQVEVQTGGFSLMPRYANNAKTGGPPTIAGWTGSAELILQGRDTAAISQLAGKVQSMTVSRVGFALSREAREKVEAEVTAQAIARFRTRADAVAKAFGMSGYTLREVSVGGDDAGQPVPRPMLRAQASFAGADSALPVEAGKATVTISVSGAVQLSK
jgi:predicted secreted protein